MSQTNPQPEKPSWVSRAFRFFVRFLFVVILGLVAGIGIYLGVTYLANRYFQSTQVNSQRIQALEDNQSLAEQQSKQRIDDIISRLQSVETSGDSRKVIESDVQSRIAVLETVQPAQASFSATLTYTQDQASTLQAGLSHNQATQQALATSLARIAQSSTDQNTAIQTLIAEWSGAKGSIASSLLDVQQLKVMELLTRARFDLYQNNLGLARQDIQSARDIVLVIQSQVPEDQSGSVTTILTQLASALDKLPAFPVAASDEIEGAWKLLVAGTANAGANIPLAGITPTPGPSLTPTPGATTKP